MSAAEQEQNTSLLVQNKVGEAGPSVVKEADGENRCVTPRKKGLRQSKTAIGMKESNVPSSDHDKYGNHWSSYLGFEETVMGSWRKPTVYEGLAGLVQKVLRLKHELKVFCKENIGDVVMEYKAAKDNFCLNQEAAMLKLRDSTDEAKLRQAVKGTKLKAKVFYNFLVEKPKVQYSKGIWDNLLLPKHRFVYWQIINTQLLTRDFLSKFILIQSTLCPVCDSEEESHEHIFYRCIFTKRVQQEVNSWLGNYSWPSSTIDLSFRCDFKKHDLRKCLLNLVTAAVYYQIWANRNCCVFDLTCASPKSISLEVRNIVHLRVLSKGPFKRSHENAYLLNVIKNW
ncbi:hypothetical protein G4B88_023025 [Cannabis sativa]|uniref:Reverse transcriptase zinc-binding domain-containing protein n=1 Tax=Cannabis sativa TaxID=3483 RepID=A0A7J6HZ86_CANSA|nr:hypothetical protein G4B88_023025 [Cannabis sativa]